MDRWWRAFICPNISDKSVITKIYENFIMESGIIYGHDREQDEFANRDKLGQKILKARPS